MKCKEKRGSAQAQYTGGMRCITVDAMHVDAMHVDAMHVDAMHVDAMHRTRPAARKTCPRAIRQKQPLKDKNDE